MAELRKAPTDDLGVPLPIIPSEKLAGLESSSEDFTKHHEFFLHGTDRFNTIGGIAMRVSRILCTEREVHNTGPKAFHRFYDASPGPPAEVDQIYAGIFTLAGYIPKQGVDLWSGSPTIRDIESGERNILMTISKKNEFWYEYLRSNRSEITQFLDKFVARQDIGSADANSLTEFLSTPKLSIMADAAHEVLNAAIHSTVAPIKNRYQVAREAGQLHPLAPVSAEAVVLNALGNEQRRERTIRRLRESLLRRLPEAA